MKRKRSNKRSTRVQKRALFGLFFSLFGLVWPYLNDLSLGQSRSNPRLNSPNSSLVFRLLCVWTRLFLFPQFLVIFSWLLSSGVVFCCRNHILCVSVCCFGWHCRNHVFGVNLCFLSGSCYHTPVLCVNACLFGSICWHFMFWESMVVC